jgi:DnaJ homolog subfamily B member 5
MKTKRKEKCRNLRTGCSTFRASLKKRFPDFSTNFFRSHSFNVHTPLKKEKIQDPPVEHDLYVTLEEINSGCVKKMKISRRVMQPDGTPKKEDKYVSISVSFAIKFRLIRWLIGLILIIQKKNLSCPKVKPGWKSGTKVTFQKEGDQTKGKIPSDIVFIIRDKPHPLFRREGSDLRYTARLTLKQVSQIFHLFLFFFSYSRFMRAS